jgi:hypothetical protein
MGAKDPQDKEFWEQVLAAHKLTMNAGKKTWLSYGHEYDWSNSGSLGDGSRRKLPKKNLHEIEG